VVTALWFGNYLLYSACAYKTYLRHSGKWSSNFSYKLYDINVLASAMKLSNIHLILTHNITHYSRFTHMDMSLLWTQNTHLNEACILLVNFQQLLISFQPDIDIRVRTHADQIWYTLLHMLHNPVKTAKPAEWLCIVQNPTVTIIELLWTMNQILHSTVAHYLYCMQVTRL